MSASELADLEKGLPISLVEFERNQRVWESQRQARTAKEDAERTAAIVGDRAAAGLARTNYATANVGLSPAMRTAILERQVMIGMSTHDVLASWGKPNQVNKTTSVTGTFETWSYPDSTLSFQNSLLTAINQVTSK